MRKPTKLLITQQPSGYHSLAEYMYFWADAQISDHFGKHFEVHFSERGRGRTLQA